jgi:hypothetical protein
MVVFQRPVVFMMEERAVFVGGRVDGVEESGPGGGYAYGGVGVGVEDELAFELTLQSPSFGPPKYKFGRPKVPPAMGQEIGLGVSEGRDVGSALKRPGKRILTAREHTACLGN